MKERVEQAVFQARSARQTGDGSREVVRMALMSDGRLHVSVGGYEGTFGEETVHALLEEFAALDLNEPAA